MKIILSFDYELFFGSYTGTVNACMLLPTEILMSGLDDAGIRATFYIDIGYLLRCKEFGDDLESHDQVVKQLDMLKDKGYDLQLHIHPHWEDAVYRSGIWDLSQSRYRLHQFDQSEIADIIARYSQALGEITGVAPISYRAGGWCIQPFDDLAEPLYKAGVRVDSTVFPGGKNISEVLGFDFTDSPTKTKWTFENDPLREVESGRYWELPISSISVSPLFFWKFIGIRKSGKQIHKAYGDGRSIPLNNRQIFSLLTRRSHSVVSMDGYKSSLLEEAYRQHRLNYGKDADMVIIGHPKAATKYSIRELAKFVGRHINHDQFMTVDQWHKEKLISK